MGQNATGFRYLLGGLALALAALALPMTAAESLSMAAGREMSRATALRIGAGLGWWRGDLWGAYALAAAQQADETADAAGAERAFRRAATRALAIAPYQPMLWLALAKREQGAPTSAGAFNAALKMAYYTAPGDETAMAIRLAMALSPAAAPDEELDELARGDVRALLARGRIAELSAIYHSVAAGGRPFIENAVRAMRPDLADRLVGPG